MKRSLIVGIILYTIGILMIVAGIFMATRMGNTALVTLEERLSMLGMCVLMIFGGINTAFGYILMKLYFEYKD